MFQLATMPVYRRVPHHARSRPNASAEHVGGGRIFFLLIAILTDNLQPTSTRERGVIMFKMFALLFLLHRRVPVRKSLWNRLAAGRGGSNRLLPVCLTLVAFTAFAPTAATQTIWHVDDDAPAGGNGESWDQPFKFLQDALAAASPGDEIRVAQGIYYPDSSENHPTGTGDRAATFSLIATVKIRGGYAGLGSGRPNDRDPDHFVSVLCGDIGLPLIADDNSFHVTTVGKDVAEPPVLDGFTICDGYANGPAYDSAGAGLYCQGTVHLLNCVFRENQARSGGGLFADDAQATMTGCAFIRNTAEQGGGGADIRDGHGILIDCEFIENQAYYGGGLCAWHGTTFLIDCQVLDNNAARGGGVHASFQDLFAHSCIFGGNIASAMGGGLFHEGRNPLFISCKFGGNYAGVSGGGLHNDYGDPRLIGCLLQDNIANRGGAMYVFAGDALFENCTIGRNIGFLGGGGLDAESLSPVMTLKNCIVWSNAGGDLSGGTYEIAYSAVPGDWPGEGNIGVDPLFLDPDGADNNPWTWEDNDYRLSPGSPCIDAGANALVPPDLLDVNNDGDFAEPLPLDLADEPRFFDDLGMPDRGDAGGTGLPVVDMGAYEFQGRTCFGDLDGDGSINLQDLAGLLGNYGQTAGMTYRQGDLDADADVDLQDLAELLGRYGEICP